MLPGTFVSVRFQPFAINDTAAAWVGPQRKPNLREIVLSVTLTFANKIILTRLKFPYVSLQMSELRTR